MIPFHNTDDSGPRELRNRIDAAKRRLLLPELMEVLGDGDHAHKSALCPFHPDRRPSFSVYQGENEKWLWKCFAGCGGGDEISYLELAEELTTAGAITRFFELAEEADTESDGQKGDIGWDEYD